MIKLTYIIILFVLCGCSSTPSIKQAKSSSSRTSYQRLVIQSEKKATHSARKVLVRARKMVTNKVILPGGCWDYVDAVFTQSGFPRKVRHYAFKGKYPKGPFVNVNKIKEGDWLYFVNHSYGDIQHSSMFIGWIDKAKKQGLMLSYAGEKRREPARYRAYDLSHVYTIVRAK